MSDLSYYQSLIVDILKRQTQTMKKIKSNTNSVLRRRISFRIEFIKFKAKNAVLILTIASIFNAKRDTLFRKISDVLLRKSYKHFIYLFVFFSLNLSSQITNTEILDHSEHRTMLTSFIENKGDIVYVIENDRWGYASTQVKISRDSELPINILPDDFKFRTDSKWFYDSNNNLRIYLFGLTNGAIDNFSGDFLEIKEENNIYTSKRIANPYLFSLEVVTSIALDTLDNIYTLTSYPRLQLFENDTLKKEISPSISSNSNLHANTIGEVYLLDSGLDSIFKINDLQMEYVNALEIDVKEVKNIDNAIWVLSEDNKLYALESSLEGSPQEIPLTFFINSLDQISENNSGIFFLETMSNGFRIYSYNAGSFISLEEYQEDYGISNKLHSINDSLFLSSGQFEIDDVANHAFVRGYNLNQEFEPVRTNMLMKEFELSYLGDTIISGGPDDIWIYDVNYTIENLGDSNTNLNSIYTSHINPQFTAAHFLFENHISQIIIPNESVSIETTKTIVIYKPTEATASITGSDYKFNESYTPIQIGITTATADLQSSLKTKIYPNPFSSYLNIESKSDQNVSLYNSNGGLVYTADINSFQLKNFENLSQGIYYILLKDTGELIKLIKMNDEK